MYFKCVAQIYLSWVIYYHSRWCRTYEAKQERYCNRYIINLNNLFAIVLCRRHRIIMFETLSLALF